MKKLKMPNAADRPSCVILAAGDFPHGSVARALLDNAERVICCDGAAEEYCASGRTPYAVVGDMDSLPEPLREALGDRVCRMPDQNTNDLWKALSYAIEQGERRITILGAFGRREDHSLGNIALLAARMHEAEMEMVGDFGLFNFIDEPTRFESRAGQQVSLFTLAPTTEISISGLRYEPPHNRLAAMWQGVSNEACGEEFEVRTNGATIVYRHL